MIFDDLAQKRSQKGHQELMNIVRTVYPEQLKDVMTYLAWKYEPRMDFKPEFDEYMKKRHSQ